MKIDSYKQNFTRYKATPKRVDLNNTNNVFYNDRVVNSGLNQLANINMAKINFTGVQEIEDNYPRHTLDNYAGCLIGGGIGDAMGAKIETFSIDKIKKLYGDSGLRYIPKTNGKYAVTDDTQMTLFTADGLIKSYLKKFDLNSPPDYNEIYSSYINWYKTQTLEINEIENERGLMGDNKLYSKRFPGKTCMDSLKNGIPGTVQNPINNSYANGGLMRIAPVGLMYYKNPSLAFETGMNCAALTHGHPDAYLSAGFQASIIACLISGKTLQESINYTLDELEKYPGNEYLKECISKAIELSKEDIETTEAIESIGRGFNGAEAMGIALYSVMKYPFSFKKAITTAVNHSGDSDTTASITGNLIGAKLGLRNIPRNWCENIEFINWLYSFSKDIFKITTTKNNNTNYSRLQLINRWKEDKLF